MNYNVTENIEKELNAISEKCQSAVGMFYFNNYELNLDAIKRKLDLFHLTVKNSVEETVSAIVYATSQTSYSAHVIDTNELTFIANVVYAFTNFDNDNAIKYSFDECTEHFERCMMFAMSCLSYELTLVEDNKNYLIDDAIALNEQLINTSAREHNISVNDYIADYTRAEYIEE